MELSQRYDNLKALVTERKEEFTNLMEFIEQETSYMSCPASTRFHLCKERGLLEHSVNVAETMIKIKNQLMPEISDESCVIVALLHDLGKAGMPGQPQYYKNTGANKDYYPYNYNRNLTYLSVPVRSIYLALQYLPLTEAEVQAIVYHDGQYVEDNRSVATREEPLTLLPQYADNWSGFVMEKGN